MNHVEQLVERAKAHEHRLVSSAHVHQHVFGRGVFAAINRKVALWITFGFGSMWAFWVLVAWQLGWIGWQTSGAGLIVKDPYPFAFCLFLSNLIQLWALPAIMVGQNVLSSQADERAHADHETLQLLAQINATQLEILQAVQKSVVPEGDRIGTRPAAASPS